MAGMRAGINAKCKDCIYDKYAGGTWREQVEACTLTTCGLWPFRPKSASKKPRAEEPADDERPAA
jgi:hypothetical protein